LGGGQGGENQARHHERNNSLQPLSNYLEPLAAQQYRVNYGFDKVQLRINYDPDKLVADNLAACALYEPPSDNEFVHEEATLTGYV